jgi:hypothetical protein
MGRTRNLDKIVRRHIRKNKTKYIAGILFFLFFLLGYLSNFLLSPCICPECNDYVKKYDGLNIRENVSYSEALETAKEYDKGGDWVCVNGVNIDVNRTFQVCNHECMHSVWDEQLAEECEKDFDKCKEMINDFTQKINKTGV